MLGIWIKTHQLIKFKKLPSLLDTLFYYGPISCSNHISMCVSSPVRLFIFFSSFIIFWFANFIHFHKRQQLWHIGFRPVCSVCKWFDYVWICYKITILGERIFNICNRINITMHNTNQRMVAWNPIELPSSTLTIHLLQIHNIMSFHLNDLINDFKLSFSTLIIISFLVDLTILVIIARTLG